MKKYVLQTITIKNERCKGGQRAEFSLTLANLKLFTKANLMSFNLTLFLSWFMIKVSFCRMPLEFFCLSSIYFNSIVYILIEQTQNFDFM